VIRSEAFSGNFYDGRNRAGPPCVSYFGTREATLPRPQTIPRITGALLSMTITTAHISPLLSLLAGALILIMPRLLNFIVALFLIINGLIGLGLLRWLHM
jgi:DUF3096 family protein